MNEKHKSQIQKLELLFQQKSEAKEQLETTFDRLADIISTQKEYERDKEYLVEKIKKLDKLIGEDLDGKYESGYN